MNLRPRAPGPRAQDPGTPISHLLWIALGAGTGLAAALALALFAGPARAAFQPLEELPVEHRAYRDIEDLVASYGLGPSFPSTRPWDRADLRAFLDSLVTRVPRARLDPVLRRLRRELDPLPGEPLVRALEDGDRIELAPYGRVHFFEDRARRDVVRDHRGGIQLSAAHGNGALLFADIYAGTQSPGPHGNPTRSRRFGLIEGVQVNTYFDRATLTFRGRRGRIEFGHTWLSWGPGVTGGLALSDGSRAFDVLEIRAPLLRRFQLEWFVASLDPVAQTYLAGHRLELRPLASLDCSIAELSRFDGNATAPLYLVPVIPYSHYEKRLHESSDLPSSGRDSLFKNNVMWSLDATWRARPGLRLYGELVVDDLSFSSERRPLAIGWQVGAHWRRLRGDDATALRLEYTRIHRYTYSSFHHHDFAFAGFPTGYPLGPDVEVVWGRWSLSRGADWTFGFDGSATRKGESTIGDAWIPGSGTSRSVALSGVIERDLRGALAVEWTPAARLGLGGTAGWARIENSGHRAGEKRTGAFGSARLDVRW